MLTSYWGIMRNAIAEGFAYPARMWGVVLVRVVTLLSALLIWRVVFSNQNQVGNYKLPELITYYSLTILVVELTRVWRMIENFSELIYKGDLSIWLLKPIRISGALMVQEFGYKLPQGLLTGGCLMLAMLFFSTWIQPPRNVAMFVCSLLLAISIAHVLYGLVGLSAFWVTQINGIKQIFARLVEVLSGSLFPLAFFPPFLQKLGTYLPFYYIHYAPISIYLGKFSNAEIGKSLMAQVVWLLVLTCLYAHVWKKGVRHYEAVGR